MKIIKIIILTIILACGNLLSDSVATVTALKGLASIQRDGKSIPVTLGIKLEAKDSIVTQDNSKLQIIFTDETIISIGKSSNFSISEYIFEDNKEPIAKFGMLKGAMRAITGKIGKIAPEKFSVATKTTTIGIRGTNFSLVVGTNGTYNAYCTYGAISVSIKGQENIVKQGFFISITPAGKIEVKEFTPADLKEMRKENFGSTKAKTTQTTKDGTTTTSIQSDSGENNEQLDVTVTDNSGIIVEDITDTITDNIQSDNISSLADIIAGYSMSKATYTGNYTGSGYLSGFGDSGTATLDINFGSDTASLVLTDSTSNSLTMSTTTSFSGTSFGVSNNSTYTATGTFQGSTGNSVAGTFNLNNEMTGTYDVSTSQTLH